MVESQYCERLVDKSLVSRDEHHTAWAFFEGDGLQEGRNFACADGAVTQFLMHNTF